MIHICGTVRVGRMTVQYIRYRILHDAAGFEAALARAARYLEKAPQCVDYELTRGTDDGTAYVLRITWTSERDHVKGFRDSELYPGFLAEIRDFAEAVEETPRHYEPTAVRGAGGRSHQG
jgi:hemoglobin